MPAAAKSEPDAKSAPTPDLVSKLGPNALKGKIREDTVVSRSRRPALGGKVTEVIRKANGGFIVQGDGLAKREFTKFQPALAYARSGEVKEDSK